MQGFRCLLLFADLVVDVVLADGAAVVVLHCNLLVAIGFDAVRAYGVHVLDTPVVCYISSCHISNFCYFVKFS